MRAQRRGQSGVVLNYRPWPDLYRELKPGSAPFSGGHGCKTGRVYLGVWRVGKDHYSAVADLHVEVGSQPAFGIGDVELDAFLGRHKRNILFPILQDATRLEQMKKLGCCVCHVVRL